MEVKGKKLQLHRQKYTSVVKTVYENKSKKLSSDEFIAGLDKKVYFGYVIIND